MIHPNNPPQSNRSTEDRYGRFTYPAVGSNPGSGKATTPGSFARKPQIAPGVRGALTFSSPDTPGMPAPSDKTAWDFLPEGWSTHEGAGGAARLSEPHRTVTFTQADGSLRTVIHPAGFTPITQLEHARLGVVTPQMKRVAQREPHLTDQQVRDEVAAGRMVIPANLTH